MSWSAPCTPPIVAPRSAWRPVVLNQFRSCSFGSLHPSTIGAPQDRRAGPSSPPATATSSGRNGLGLAVLTAGQVLQIRICAATCVGTDVRVRRPPS